MNRIIIVARYPTIRAGLASLLADDVDFVVAGEADDPAELPDLIDLHLPDALLIDLVDDPPEQFQALRELSTAASMPPLVMLFASATDALAGVSIPNANLLLRDATGDEIRTALRTAIQGLVTMDPRVVREFSEHLEDETAPEPASEPIRLTPREREVLGLIAGGFPNKSIARDLGISEHTVKFHVGSIFRKLDVSSRSEAIAVAARRGLLVL